MKYALVKTQDFDDILISKHNNKSAAENKMIKLGGTPNSFFQKGMKIVELDKYNIIDLFGKKVLKPKSY